MTSDGDDAEQRQRQVPISADRQSLSARYDGAVPCSSLQRCQLGDTTDIKYSI